MHVRLFSDELETATDDGSEGLAPGSSEPRPGSMIRFFSFAKESAVPTSYRCSRTRLEAQLAYNGRCRGTEPVHG